MTHNPFAAAQPWKHLAESSEGPVVKETAEEALARRARYAAEHPLAVPIRIHDCQFIRLTIGDPLFEALGRAGVTEMSGVRIDRLEDGRYIITPAKWKDEG